MLGEKGNVRGDGNAALIERENDPVQPNERTPPSESAVTHLRSFTEIEALLKVQNSDLRVSRSAALTSAAFAPPQVEIRTSDRGESFEVRVDVGPTRILTCVVPAEVKREVVAKVKEMRSLVALETRSHDELSQVVESLLSFCSDDSYLPAHQRAGALWLTLNYWLADGLRGQLHPGALRGHVGFRDAQVSAASSIAAQMLGGDASYFVVRGRDSHEIAGVQFVSMPGGPVSIIAVTGMHERYEWQLGALDNDNLAKVMRFLELVTHSETQDLSILGEPVSVESPWSQSVLRAGTLAHLGSFATKLESTWTSTPPQLMPGPVIVPPSDMNEVGKNKVVARFSLSDEKYLAVLVGKDGVSEIAISPGKGNWFGRKEWTSVWKWSSFRGEALDIVQLTKRLRSLDYRALPKGARRVEFDGFMTSPVERLVERCLSLKRVLFSD